jgi:hypothetical protein
LSLPFEMEILSPAGAESVVDMDLFFLKVRPD